MLLPLEVLSRRPSRSYCGAPRGPIAAPNEVCVALLEVPGDKLWDQNMLEGVGGVVLWEHKKK